MNKSQIINKFLSEACLDERVQDGIFDIGNSAHMEVLREIFIKYGLLEDDATELNNRILDGKYPERQAYNKNGILVTFPTPEYKQRAIQKGTHFEDNPVKQKGAPVFNGGEQPQQPSGQPSSLPASNQPAGKPSTPASSPQSSPSSLPPSDVGGEQPDTVSQGGKQMAVEPVGGIEKKEKEETPPTPPPAPPKTPERKAAEREIVRQILATDDTSLSSTPTMEQVILNHQLTELCKLAESWAMYDAARFLKSHIKIL